jgi:hypothetical protein
MAIFYNIKDDAYYGTNAERVASTASSYPETSKFYETDTKNIYLIQGGTWILM